MKFRLEATPDEIREKAPELIGRLAKAVAPHAPDVADALEKAATTDKADPELRHLALREAHAQVAARYRRQMDRMVQEIADAVDAHVEKPAPDTADAKVIDLNGAAG